MKQTQAGGIWKSGRHENETMTDRERETTEDIYKSNHMRDPEATSKPLVQPLLDSFIEATCYRNIIQGFVLIQDDDYSMGKPTHLD